MLEKESLWQTASECHELLTQAGIPHALFGGVAVCLHGYQRNTVDLAWLIRPDDSARVRAVLKQQHFAWQADAAEFRSPGGLQCNS
jgi:hypothetical protein